ncbi:MAG: hypothetical protein EHM28_12165, partial [Spirochaetaceae bacterium]
MKKHEVTIVSSFTVDPVRESIGYWLGAHGYDAVFRSISGNQVIAQLLSPDGILHAAKGTGSVFVRIEDFVPANMIEHNEESGKVEFKELLTRNIKDLADAIEQFCEVSKKSMIVCICPGSPGETRGIRADIMKDAGEFLAGAMEKNNSVTLITAEDILGLYPMDNYYDYHADKLAHIPYVAEFFSILGTVVSRRILASIMDPCKAIILDCDNTLWAGVCGEDGVSGIAIDGVHLEIQQFMKAQKERGRLLCLCSKNNEKDIRE